MNAGAVTPSLRPSDFVHPEDERALQAMKQIPLFPQVLKAFMKLGQENHFHTMSMASRVRLGPDQFPHVYNLVPPICDFFGIEEPMVFLEQGEPNAYVTGDTKTFLVITDGLLEKFEEDELRAVIAHECGHIVCRHMLYHSMAHMLQSLGESSLPFVAQLSVPVKLAILYWSRRSEFTADRAAALYMRGADSMVEAIIRLAGATKSLPWEINRAAFMRQAEDFSLLTKSGWNDTLQAFQSIQESHPLLAPRAREIDLWCKGQQFAKLVEALDRSGATTMITCPSCRESMPSVSRFCHHCGVILSLSASKQSLKS
jgi:hypothetical protein